MKYLVKEYELFPALDLVDISNYEPEIQTLLENELEEIPDFLVSNWERAKDDWRESEDAIRGYLKTGLH